MATYLAQVVGMLSSMSHTISINNSFPIDPDRVPREQSEHDGIRYFDGFRQ